MSHLLNQLKSNVLVADGAIGTIFYSEGLDTCPEAYNLTHPDKVERIHRSYIEAGADVIQTNTYGANFEKLKSFGLEHKVKEIHQAAVQIAKRAANEDNYTWNGRWIQRRPARGYQSFNNSISYRTSNRYIN